MLWELGKHSALRLHDSRILKKDPNKGPWFKMPADPLYHAGLALRYRIERKFGEAKAWHRFGRCRYRGLDRFKIQSYLTRTPQKPHKRPRSRSCQPQALPQLRLPQ
jgi:hypothetical protein